MTMLIWSQMTVRATRSHRQRTRERRSPLRMKTMLRTAGACRSEAKVSHAYRSRPELVATRNASRSSTTTSRKTPMSTLTPTTTSHTSRNPGTSSSSCCHRRFSTSESRARQPNDLSPSALAVSIHLFKPFERSILSSQTLYQKSLITLLSFTFFKLLQ